MKIIYKENKKALPCDQLYLLFLSAGWADEQESPELLKTFNKPFINSTLVISAWDNKHLVGTVRVLSDKIIRSVIYDLIVLPEYQSTGIGKELIKRCIAHFPNSEWLVGTTKDKAKYYEKFGFSVRNEVFLSIQSVYQKQ